MRALALVLLLAVTACQTTVPKEALQLSQESLQNRQLQSRRFETPDEKMMMAAAAQTVQDLGFKLDESETPLGVITASKDRDATEAGQVAGAIMLALLIGYVPHVDDVQKMRASIVTRQIDKKNVSVRVTFQRVVWDTSGKISLREQINDEAAYKEFFDKLSQSIFLEANQI